MPNNHILSKLYTYWNNKDDSKHIIKALDELVNKFEYLDSDGVRDGLEMEVVATVANLCIIMCDKLGNEITRYNTNCPDTFKYIIWFS